MDVYQTVSRISKLGRYAVLLSFVMLMLNISILNATSIGTALSGLCTQVQQFLGVALVLMILLAAVTYAVGQIMGAETRARATVWATAMLTGAVIGAIIYVITPYIISQIAPTSGVTTAGACPTGTGAAPATP